MRKSIEPTPWAVICRLCGRQYLTKRYYDYQMSRPDDRWACPVCGEYAEWDEETHEESYLDQQLFGEEIKK